MERIGRPAPPTGLRRSLFRLPVWVYRARLGALLGHRFVLIHHTGRTTGRSRQVVVEVVDHDRATGAVTVASGFGPRSQWYRNLLATPAATIELGSRTIDVHARPLSPEEAASAMAGYARAHPRTARRLARFMGFAVDGSDEDYRAVGREVPMVRLEPDLRGGNGSSASRGGRRPWRQLRATRVVGRGHDDFAAATRAVLSWRAQRLLAVRVEPRDAPVRVGTEVRVRLGVGPLALSAPARVLHVVDEPDRQGFTYGTRPGHPLTGEEAFVVHLEPDGRVVFTVSASSCPASRLTRAAGPALPLFQRFVAGRYLRSVARAVRRTH